MTASPASPGPSAQPTHSARICLSISEAAAAIGVSTDTFRRHVLPELRVIQASPRLVVVRVAELERWAQRAEAVSSELVPHYSSLDASAPRSSR
jgi:hypothetical protein